MHQPDRQDPIIEEIRTICSNSDPNKDDYAQLLRRLYTGTKVEQDYLSQKLEFWPDTIPGLPTDYKARLLTLAFRPQEDTELQIDHLLARFNAHLKHHVSHGTLKPDVLTAIATAIEANKLTSSAANPLSNQPIDLDYLETAFTPVNHRPVDQSITIPARNIMLELAYAGHLLRLTNDELLEHIKLNWQSNYQPLKPDSYTPPYDMPMLCPLTDGDLAFAFHSKLLPDPNMANTQRQLRHEINTTPCITYHLLPTEFQICTKRGLFKRGLYVANLDVLQQASMPSRNLIAFEQYLAHRGLLATTPFTNQFKRIHAYNGSIVSDTEICPTGFIYLD